METDTGLDHSGSEAPPAPITPYYTVGQLQAMVKEKTGKETASRNRPALLKKLGLADVPRPADMKHDGRKDGDPARNPSEKQRAKAKKKVAAKSAKRVNGKKPGKPRPSKATPLVIRSDTALHATALAYVKRAMSRREPPSLRNLCEELRKAKVKKPRGGTNWWPSSVQNLMRQAGYDAGGKPGNK